MAKTVQPKESLSLQQYRESMNFLQIHIQLLDASLIQTERIVSAEENKNRKINTVLGLSRETHKSLNHPVKQCDALIKHSQKKNIEFAIIRVFNMFTTYLRSITKEMFNKKPLLIVGKAVVNKDGNAKDNLSLSYAEIIGLKSFPAIEDKIVSDIFRSIENQRNTTLLLDKILKDTKVNISNEIKVDALAYLEMRHLFIHNNGLADIKFARSYGEKFQPRVKNKRPLPANVETFTEAINAVTKLISCIDIELIKHGMIDNRLAK